MRTATPTHYTANCGVHLRGTATVRTIAGTRCADVLITDLSGVFYRRHLIITDQGEIVSDDVRVYLTSATETGEFTDGGGLILTAAGRRRYDVSVVGDAAPMECHRLLDDYSPAARMIVDAVAGDLAGGRM